MGFGCNAAGVVAARIIQSPRERLIAILTNAFVPCNGRFPTLIALATIFFGGDGASGLIAAAVVGGLVIVGVFTTLGVSWALAHTILRGLPSSFALELPPYRRPRFFQVLVCSVFDRTLFVLGRAVAIAAPAGALTWLCANLRLGGQSLLALLTGWLDPLGRAGLQQRLHRAVPQQYLLRQYHDAGVQGDVLPQRQLLVPVRFTVLSFDDGGIPNRSQRDQAERRHGGAHVLHVEPAHSHGLRHVLDTGGMLFVRPLAALFL